MQRLKKIFKRSEFHFLLFLSAFAIFHWQFLNPSLLAIPQHFFCYLFVCWALLVLILFFVSSNYGAKETEDDKKPIEKDNV